MKKPKDVADLADRLTQAATAPLMAAAPATLTAVEATPIPVSADAARPTSPRAHKPAPKRSTKTVYLRVPAPLYDHYDSEAVRRTKATGRGVTVQQVILDRLAERSA